VSEIEEDKKLRHAKYMKYGLSFQPCIYIIENENRYFIKFDDVTWEFNSLQKVLDVCFKTYQVLNLQYQFECNQMWLLIQRFFYDIETIYDKVSPSLEIIVNEKQLEMNCFICSRKLNSYGALKNHVRSFHDTKLIKQFTCKKHDCRRMFSSLYTMYDHLRFVHIAHSNAFESSNTPVIVPQESHKIGDNSPVDIQDSDSEELINSSNDRNILDEDLKFVLQLYGNLHLSRSAVNEIISATTGLLASKNSYNNMDLLDSEYKRLKAFRQRNLYIDPQRVTLSHTLSTTGTPHTICGIYIDLKKIFGSILNSYAFRCC